MAIQNVEPKIGDHFFRHVFRGGKGFVSVLLEAIKNSRDWGATIIRILTSNKSAITIMDNGVGMSTENREHFIRIGDSNAAIDRKKSGKYGTGQKRLMYGFSKSVHVITAPKDEPNVVWTVSFTTDRFDELARTGGIIQWKSSPKTQATWPYTSIEEGEEVFTFGTVITYELADPTSKSLRRGQRLAQELSSHLDMRFENIIRIDNMTSLPAKELVGEAFHASEPNEILEFVDINLYRPKKPSKDDELRLTGHEIGEATMHSFVVAIAGDPKLKLDPLYRHPEICGTISSPYLADHATETRDKISPSIVDDPKTHMFVHILNRQAKDATRCLHLSNETSFDADLDQEMIDIIEQITARYETDENPPPTVNENKQPPGKKPTPKPGGGKTPIGAVLQLSEKKDVELGETFTITAIIRKDLQSTISPTQIRWQTSRSKCTNIKIDGATVTLTANEMGTGLIRAEIPGTTFESATRFSVVNERLFRVNPGSADIKQGEEIILTTDNVDKLKGKLRWRLDGPGKLETRPKTAKYTGTRIGTVSITGYDEDDPNTKSRSEINVVPHSNDFLILIRETWFSAQWDNMVTAAYARPVIMEPYEPMPKMWINCQAPGFKEARKKGVLYSFIIQAAAIEYTRFTYQSEDFDMESFSPAQMLACMRDLHAEAYIIFEEMMKAN